MAANVETTRLKKALADYPRSEFWRLQTDGWQVHLGPDNFRQAFYDGMEAGFNYINRHLNDRITPELIEGIYQSAFRFESEFTDETESEFFKGYNLYLGGFEIYYPDDGVEHTAGVSPKGLEEFCQSMRLFAESQGDRTLPKSCVRFRIDGEKWPLHLDALADDFQQQLNTHIINATATKAQSVSQLDDNTPMTQVLLDSNAPSDRDDVIQLVQADIDKYYHELEQAQQLDSPDQKQQAQIKAINALVIKLHQSHYFPDGNGRTFVFLLANLLLLQNNYDLKITHTPAHYAGFSSDERYQETLRDMDYFNSCKVTHIKAIIEQHVNGDNFHEQLSQQLPEQFE